MSVPHAERQLHVYDTLREEILTNIKVTLRQNTRGIALIVIIAGYSLQFGPRTVLAVMPGILGYLFMLSRIHMYDHTRQAEISYAGF